MMKSKMKLMPLLVSVTLISGCTVLPGSNMSTMGKDVIKQQDADFDLDKMVNVYPLTPRLIDQLRPRPNVARPNMTLESEIANYQYRVGPGGRSECHRLGSPGTHHASRSVPQLQRHRQLGTA